MKKIIPMVICGLAVPAAVYAALRTSEPAWRDRPDRWLETFQSKGLRAQLRETSTEPDRHFLLTGHRELFATTDRGIRLRTYYIEEIKVQIAYVPRTRSLEGVLDAIVEEGEPTVIKSGRRTRKFHVLRIGRYLIAFRTWTQNIGLRRKRVPAKLADRILSAFEREARQNED